MIEAIQRFIIIIECRCYIDGCENRTSIDFQPSWLNNTIPWDDDNLFIAQCFRYNRTWSDPDECQLNIDDDYSLQECNEWIYDESVFHSTIVTQVWTKKKYPYLICSLFVLRLIMW